MSAAEDLQAYLTDLGIVDGSTEWQSSQAIVHDGLPDAPVDRLVVFTDDGGLQPETPADAPGQGSVAWEYPQVQVRARGHPRQGPVEVRAKLREVYDAVHGSLGVTMGDVRYERVLALTSAPAPLGTDANERYEMTQSYQMTRPIRVPVSL